MAVLGGFSAVRAASRLWRRAACAAAGLRGRCPGRGYAVGAAQVSRSARGGRAGGRGRPCTPRLPAGKRPGWGRRPPVRAAGAGSAVSPALCHVPVLNGKPLQLQRGLDLPSAHRVGPGLRPLWAPEVTQQFPLPLVPRVVPALPESAATTACLPSSATFARVSGARPELPSGGSFAYKGGQPREERGLCGAFFPLGTCL